MQGLGELPAKISFNLIQKVQSQANKQLDAIELMKDNELMKESNLKDKPKKNN